MDFTSGYWPLLVYSLASILLVVTMLGVSYVLGQKHDEPATGEPFESGIVSVGDAHLRFSVDFYLVAILFVIFDLEAVFIFAWAIAFLEVGWVAYWAIVLFILVLAVALIYEWRMGVLNWGQKVQASRNPESSTYALETE